MTPLLQASPDEWIEAVIAGFDEFLIDHAANERKASAAALGLAAHYPDKQALLTAMVDLSIEELNHYKQVIRLMLDRGLTPTADEKDPYVNQILKAIRKGPEHYFLDRLLSSAVIEARGAERFARLADSLTGASLTDFYRALARSEQNHYQLFLNLANTYFPVDIVEVRWQDWLVLEADIMSNLEIRPRLH